MFHVNAAKNAAEIPVAGGKQNTFPEEFSFVHASIYEPDLSDYLIAFR